VAAKMTIGDFSRGTRLSVVPDTAASVIDITIDDGTVKTT
jgi:hypothetical protein